MPAACILVQGVNSCTKSVVVFRKRVIACYASIKHFQHFLEGCDFTLKTNYKLIVKKFQHNSPATSPRQARSIDYILQFTSNIEHVSGNDNIADALSRPFEPPLNNLLTPFNKPLDFLELAIAQRSDSKCEELRLDNHSALVLKDIALAEAFFPHFSDSDVDHRPTPSCSPTHTNQSLDESLIKTIQNIDTLLGDDVSTHLRVSKIMS